MARIPLTLVVVAGLWASACDAPAAPVDANPAALADAVVHYRSGDVIPRFPLVDSAGHAVLGPAVVGTATLVGFAFSRCAVPSACPATLAFLRAVEAEAQARGLGAALATRVVTIDPVHDTPAVLAAWRTRSGVQGAFLTGDAKTVELLSSLFNAGGRAAADPAGGATLAHAPRAVLLDARGVAVAVFVDGAMNVADVLARLRGSAA